MIQKKPVTVKEYPLTLLLLIRHGTNDWVHGRLAGWTPGVRLNEEGRQQAAALSERLGDLPINAIYSSPLERCVETATAIAQPRGMQLRLIEQIGEVRYGEWQGAELKELYKHELWPGVQFYPSGTRFPNGETLGEAQMRMVQALDGIRARHPQEIVAICSHADIIKLAIAYYVGMHIDLFQRLVINPCSLTAIHFERMGPRLMALNDTGALTHLRPKPEPAAEASAEAGAEGATMPASDAPAADTTDINEADTQRVPVAAGEEAAHIGSQQAVAHSEQEHV